MNLKELHSFKMSDAVKFHDQLNPLLFHGQHLDSTVRKKLLVIAEDFLNELGISQFKVKDVTISGSNAAYSYTPHSDIDLHVIVDMGQFDNDEVYQELFNAKKSVYNDKHDIKIKDIPIELYVQPASDPHVSLGEYSILNDHWIKFPLKRRANVDQNNTRAKYEQLKRLCQTALRERDLKKVGRVIKKIKQYRKAGLANFGEFGPENLAYKMVKNQEYLQKLYDLRDKLHSVKLSFETMYQNPKKIAETIGPHEKKELEIMLHGSKPAALIDFDELKQPNWQDAIQKNNWTVEKVDIASIPTRPGTIWASYKPLIIVSKDPNVAKSIKRLMLNTLGKYPNGAPESYHIQLGRLLGYDEEDIEHFLNHTGYEKPKISEENTTLQKIYGNKLPERDETSKEKVLYHVTTTANIPQIKKRGILPLQPSNWVQAGTGERYGGGEIFAFDNLRDAQSWAGKMDWEKNKKMGSGKISIIKFTDDSDWEKDPAPLVTYQGTALKKHGRVKPKNIIDAQPFTTDIARSLASPNTITEENTTLQKIYGNKLPKHDEIFWNYVSSEDLKKQLLIKTMSKHSVMHHLLGQYRVEHIDDLVDRLDDEQVETLGKYMLDPNLSNYIIVVDDNKIIDGQHRALAAAIQGSPIRYVDLSDELKEANIDNNTGWGAVGNNREVNYFGLRVNMTPSTFLKLAAPLNDEPNQEMIDYIQKGGAIGSPHLYITVPEEWESGDFSMPARVSGHEGRHRMKSIFKIEGDKPVEVHLFPYGYRNRHLTPEIVNKLNKSLFAEKSRRIVLGPLFSMVDNKQGVAEELEQGIPSVLYHATYKQRLKNIKLTGLGAGGKRNWPDSRPGVVYLALDPHVAESYAETALDDLDADWDIVILQVSTNGLDSNKFHLDSNVQDNEGDTVEYHGIIPPSNISLYKQGVAESENNSIPPIGINVRSDSDIDYADLIVDGKKKYESRNTNSLRPYVGKTVGIIRTGSGPAVAIGQATIGEPIVADEKKFNKLRKKHLVPKGSKFDINSNGTKYLYPIIDPVRWDDEKLVKQKGIVARKIEEQGVAEAAGYLDELGFADSLNNLSLPDREIIDNSTVANTIGQKPVRIFNRGSSNLYFFATDTNILALVLLDGTYLKAIKNFTDEKGMVYSLLNYIVNLEGLRINVSPTEPLTAEGFKWLLRLAKNTHGLRLTTSDGHAVDTESLKREWNNAKLTKEPGKTGLMISEKSESWKKRLIENENSLMPFRIFEYSDRIIEASGYIPSEKEKNDPRFKTALTVDIHPNSIKKNAKAFGFKTSRAGIPPLANPNGKVNEVKRIGNISRPTRADWEDWDFSEKRKYFSFVSHSGATVDVYKDKTGILAAIDGKVLANLDGEFQNAKFFKIDSVASIPSLDLYASELYKALILDKNLTLISGDQQTYAGSKIWDRLSKVPNITVEEVNDLMVAHKTLTSP